MVGAFGIGTFDVRLCTRGVFFAGVQANHSQGHDRVMALHDQQIGTLMASILRCG
jgi:hypothetical protein